MDRLPHLERLQYSGDTKTTSPEPPGIGRQGVPRHILPIQCLPIHPGGDGGNIRYDPAVIFSVCSDIFAVRSSLSQLKGRPSMARFSVLNSTSENSCL